VIVAGRERRRHTPSEARHFLDTMRGLFGWAVDAQHCKTDPTFGVEGPVLPRGGGFRVWTEEDVAAYERRWPIGGFLRGDKALVANLDTSGTSLARS
jgi:site-specific recombinase XerD